jgi:aryl-alcohol dehydrogenase-like predicted oxidoreductase
MCSSGCIDPAPVSASLAQNLALVERLESIAKRKGCTPRQLALAWVLAQGPDVVPIPGTKRIKYLEENLGAAQVKLSEEDLRELEQAFPHDQVGSGQLLAWRLIQLKSVKLHTAQWTIC